MMKQYVLYIIIPNNRLRFQCMVRFFIHVLLIRLLNKFFLFLHIYSASIFFITDFTPSKNHTRKALYFNKQD